MIHRFTPPLDDPVLIGLIAPGATGTAVPLDRPAQARLARLAAVLGWTVAADGTVRGASALRPALLAALAADILALPEDRPAPALRARLSAMTVRAESRLRAGGPDPRVEVIARTEPYAGFFSVEDYVLRHPRHDGTMTGPLARTVFVSADACVVLPYDAARDRVLLIEQFRPGPFGRGDADCWLIETIAGRIDAGETAADTARREAVEEAGVTLGELIPLPGYYPTPAAKSEFIHSFIAAADLPDDRATTGGLASEGEDIRVLPTPLPAAMAMLAEGRIRNAPLIIALMTLWRDRETIRRRFGLEGAPPSP